MERNDLSTGLRRLAIGTTLASAMTFVTSVFQNLSESLSGSAGILVNLLVLPAGIASLVASIIYLMGLALLYQEHRSYLHSFVCTSVAPTRFGSADAGRGYPIPGGSNYAARQPSGLREGIDCNSGGVLM